MRRCPRTLPLGHPRFRSSPQQPGRSRPQRRAVRRATGKQECLHSLFHFLFLLPLSVLTFATGCRAPNISSPGIFRDRRATLQPLEPELPTGVFLAITGWGAPSVWTRTLIIFDRSPHSSTCSSTRSSQLVAYPVQAFSEVCLESVERPAFTLLEVRDDASLFRTRFPVMSPEH